MRPCETNESSVLSNAPRPHHDIWKSIALSKDSQISSAWPSDDSIKVKTIKKHWWSETYREKLSRRQFSHQNTHMHAHVMVDLWYAESVVDCGWVRFSDPWENRLLGCLVDWLGKDSESDSWLRPGLWYLLTRLPAGQEYSLRCWWRSSCRSIMLR